MDVPVLETQQGFPESSFKYTPLRHVRTLFVRFVQGLFSAAPPGSYHWDPDDSKTELLVSSEGRLDPEVVGQRPAVSMTRGPVQFYSLGLDDMHSYDVQTGRKEKVILVPGTMVLNCISRVALECEDLAWIIGEHLWLLRHLMMRAGFFDIGQRIQVGSPSAAGSIITNDSGDEFTVVPVSVPFQFPRKSSYAPLGQSVVTNIQQSLSISASHRLYSQGVPTGTNTHVCAPPSFAPQASDAYGRSPDPAGLRADNLKKQPHPLNPSKLVFVRSVYGNRPGQRSPNQARSVPIQDPCVEESP